MKLYDMHLHTKFSHDASAEPLDIINTAISRGLSGVAFTEHCDTNYLFEERHTMENLGASINEAKRLSKLYSGEIEVLCGIEIGESFYNKKRTEAVLNNYGDKIDALLCSVHVIDWDKHPEAMSEYKYNTFSDEDVRTTTDKYYEDIVTMLEYLDGDILCHLTYPYRYINLAYGLSSYSYTDYLLQIKDILRLVIKKDMALEVNTSNLAKYPNGFYMVDKEILEIYRDLGGRLITLGSDAHTHNFVGHSFNEALTMIKSAGFSEYYCFKSRNPISIKID